MIDNLGDEIEKDEERKAKVRVGMNQFGHDLQMLIDRHGLENDLTYAEVIGTLTLAIHDQHHEAMGLFPPKDEEGELC